MSREWEEVKQECEYGDNCYAKGEHDIALRHYIKANNMLSTIEIYDKLNINQESLRECIKGKIADIKQLKD